MAAKSNVLDWDLSAIEDVLAQCPRIPAQAVEQLHQYALMLYQWSGKMSLISTGDRPILVAKHLIPCLAMVPIVVSHPHNTIVDFGSGGGLPGVPIQIMLPDSVVIMVDSRRKRTSFLHEVVRRLNLERAEVFHGRFEDWPGLDETVASVGTQAGGVDLVVARAVDNPAGVFAETRSVMAQHGRLLLTSKPDQANSEQGFESQKLSWDGGEQWVSSKPKEPLGANLSTKT